MKQEKNPNQTNNLEWLFEYYNFFFVKFISFYLLRAQHFFKFLLKIFFIKSWISIKFVEVKTNINLFWWFNSLVIKKNFLILNIQTYSLLRLKKLELFLEVLLIESYKINLVLYLNNILNDLSNLFLFRFKNFLSKQEIKKNIIFFYIIFYLKSASLLCKYISYVLLKNNYHLKNLRHHLNNIYKIYLNQMINFSGFKLFFSGKINGKMRKQRYFYKLGKILLNTIETKLQFYFLPLYTKYGIFSIKIWLVF